MATGFSVMDALNKNSKAGIEETPKARFRTKDISIFKMYRNEMNFYSIAAVEELAGDILTFGLKQNLELVYEPCEKGEYRIVAGERRWLALKHLVSKGYKEFESNKGQDFRRVLEEITKTYIPIPKSGKWATAGMVRGSTGSTAWRQMDAQYWGVPQRRKRIYLVHDFAGDSAGEILFECESVLGYTTQGRTTKQDIARSSERGIGTTNIEHIPYRNCGYGVYAEGIGTLRASRGNNGGGSETLIVRKEMTFAEAYQHHGYRISDVANTQTAGANTSIRGDTSLIIENGIIPFDDFAKNEDGRYWACICEKCVKQNNISENLLDDVGVGICGVAGCENEADYYIDFPEIEEPKGSVWKIPLYLLQGEKEHKKYKVRRFTPTECERLNGFPDGWTEKRSDGKDSSDTARYVSLGNSIAVPCADRVFAGIIAVEKRKQEAAGQ